jgi:DNA-binding IclR family transcriptional regulator
MATSDARRQCEGNGEHSPLMTMIALPVFARHTIEDALVSVDEPTADVRITPYGRMRKFANAVADSR